MLEKDASEPVVAEEPINSFKDNEKSNGECEVLEKLSQDEPCSTSEDSGKATEGKGRELKPPRVLEVATCSF